jgi:hypothetical protein
MNPFLEIPIYYTVKPVEKISWLRKLLGNKPADIPDVISKQVQGRVLPGEIACHYPGQHYGTVIVLKSGHKLLTTWDATVVDYARRQYVSFIAKNPKLESNVQITGSKDPE